MSAQSTAIVRTRQASTYLQQLCRHWSHKFPCRFDECAGQIVFPSGEVDLAVVADGLSVTVRSHLAENLPTAKQVVADHLDRFAVAEAPLEFCWIDG